MYSLNVANLPLTAPELAHGVDRWGSGTPTTNDPPEWLQVKLDGSGDYDESSGTLTTIARIQYINKTASETISDGDPAYVIISEVDESINDSEKPNAYVLRLAIAKAEKISKLYPQDIVLSADTVVSKGRRILPKAKNELDAKKCLKLLSGGSHCVFSAVVIFFICIIQINFSLIGVLVKSN